ncbi:hypothetical protein AB0395_45200 [Streptosporangium sp. NPDC051023]|uniref:hypothetical protein n=1 Tax=Streptosporangium sp. NPDC051023 TaxID=3155410 RepID=UPI00344D2D40
MAIGGHLKVSSYPSRKETFVKIRRLSAAALLAAALGAAALGTAAPASAASQTSAHVSGQYWVVTYGPYLTLAECQAKREEVRQDGDPTTPCIKISYGYVFRVYMS